MTTMTTATTNTALASSSASSPAKPTPRTPSSSSSYRLLYRGALSLPDSHMLLEGLSFTANISPDASDTRLLSPSNKLQSLLENPLALALESMRGRPSLHFLGTERLSDVRLDTKNDIHVHVHPNATLSRIYFENVFCLLPITSQDGRTDEGIRIGLGDTDEPGTSDFLIYGQLRPTVPQSLPHHDQSHAQILPSPSTSSAPPQTLHILAARILPALPPPTPRPDDPTPRQPPAHLISNLGAKRKRDASTSATSSSTLSFSSVRMHGPAGSNKRQRAGEKGKAGGVQEDERVRMAREVMLNMPKPGTGPVFKMPSVPVRTQALSSGGLIDDDVFGGAAIVTGNGKGKEKASVGSNELEKANKTVIKQAAVACLAKHGLKKADPDFHELFQAVYRGVCFALRGVMRMQAVNVRVVERLLEAHTRMYVNGNGENHVVPAHEMPP